MAHDNLGNALAGRGQVDAAIDPLSEGPGNQARLREAHSNLGLPLADLRPGRRGHHHYQKALEIKPDYAEAHDNLGWPWWPGRVDEAIAHYRKALEIKPDYAEAYYNLASVLVGRGQVDAAIAHYRKALEIQPHVAEAHTISADLADRGPAESAIAHYQKAVEIRPDYATGPAQPSP